MAWIEYVKSRGGYRVREKRGKRNVEIGFYLDEADAISAAHGDVKPSTKKRRIRREILFDGDIARVPLSTGQYALIDAVDAHLVEGVSWQCVRRYAHCKQRGYLHRLLCSPAPGLEVDHINGDCLDNRRANLRVSTISQNRQNRPASKNNKLGVKGVVFFKGRYRASIMANGQRFRLGSFATLDEAKRVYDGVAEFLHGDFKRS